MSFADWILPLLLLGTDDVHGRSAADVCGDPAEAAAARDNARPAV